MKKDECFYRLGVLVYKCRWPIIVVALILILCCFPFLPHIISPFQTAGFIAENSESDTTQNYINKKLGYDNNRYVVLYTSKEYKVTDSLFREEVRKSLAQLKHFPLAHDIIYPFDNKEQISKDKHTAYALIVVKDSQRLDDGILRKFESSIKQPAHLKMELGGQNVFLDAVNRQTQLDLFKADYIAAPLSIITLLIVFGSVVAAIIPIILGGGCALLILTALYFLGHSFSLSIFTLNIALLLGLCLSLDYALFIINRFRQEIRNGLGIIEAIAVTQATAGKAVFFSGLAVFISLSALLLFPVNILFSVGIGGLTAVFIAVTVALIVLPAVLGVLKSKVNLLSIGIIKVGKDGSSPFWHRLVSKVVNHAVIFFFALLAVIFFMSYPFVHVNFGISDFRILPEHSDSRAFFDMYRANFNDNELMPIQIAVTTKHGKILSKENLNRLYNLTRKLKDNPLVDEVFSIVDSKPEMSREQYHSIYNMPADMMPESVKVVLKTTSAENMTVVTVVSKYLTNDPETRNLIRQIRTMENHDGLILRMTGEPVASLDLLNTIAKIFPYAILWILGFTYIILIVLLRSLFLPLKALVMTILSLFASYGVLAFVVQEGHFSWLLNFEPQGMLDISLLIIIFCALFGFSMDYEVFLLSRIKEYYDKTGDNVQSIVFGVEQSSRIITSAAIIVIFICASFMVADILMIKAFGLGIAVAIFTDAFLIRSIMVPATMTLMGKWNWYLPRWLDRILPKI